MKRLLNINIIYYHHMKKLKIRRYKKAIIIFLVFYLLCTTPFILLDIISGGGIGDEMSKILPFDSMILQIMAIFLLIPAGGIVGGFLPGYLFAPLMLVIYKHTIGFRMEYGIQHREKPEKFKSTWKGIFPALLAVNLALMIGITTFARDYIVSPNYLDSGVNGESPLWPIVGFTSLIPIMTAVSTGIFSPVWFLSDAGIVFTNKNKVKDIINPIKVFLGHRRRFMRNFAKKLGIEGPLEKPLNLN